MCASSPSTKETLVLLLLGVLLFGKRLPEVAGSMTKVLKAFQNRLESIEVESVHARPPLRPVKPTQPALSADDRRLLHCFEPVASPSGHLGLARWLGKSTSRMWHEMYFWSVGDEE